MLISTYRASFDNSARIWDADRGTCLHILRRNTDVVYSLSFSPQTGDYLAIGSNDRRASVFRVKVSSLARLSDPCSCGWQDGELMCEYVHPGSVYEALWHPTRDVLAITGQFQDVKVVPVKTQ
jgi:WD40 repeat protein